MIGFVFALLLALSAGLWAQTPGKRNERPDVDPARKPAKSQGKNHYSYEFTRPGFVYEKIVIDHDETGKGTISFLKDGFEEMLTDPVQLSPVTLAKINDALGELNFLESDEEYQHQNDFSHLGNIKIKINRGGRERSVKYNWTENKFAKTLMDEYRRIGNEYTWRFEMLVARENQPLLTPGMMDGLDAFIKRNEISDPTEMLPFLTELSNDERLPLMARNRAAKLIKQIDKKKK